MTSYTDRILPGVALMLGFCLFAPLIDTAAKLASATVPVGQITTARYVVQAALMLPIALVLGPGLRLTRRGLMLVTLRALVSILATFTFVWAVSVMPIADALAIAFVEPFILLFLGRLMFGDEVGPRRIGASVVGFGGALLVIQPSLAAFGWVALMPLSTALFFALYMLVTRQMSREMHPVPMQFHTAWVGMILCLPLMAIGALTGTESLGLVMPQGTAWAYLVAVGAAATVSHMFMTYALKFAPSATLAPLHYLEIVSAVALGYWVFGDFPKPLTWAGIAVIVASGLFIIHRERLTARSRLRPVPSAAE
ncbi:MAG: DMT family transporter [Gemmobacter sp.]|nr:DMT family transporter [Gemmobacter sp.]